MLLASTLLGLLAALPIADDALLQERTALLKAAFPQGIPADLDPQRPGSEQAFLAVLASPLFLHEAVGPFDLYVFLADGYAKELNARKVLTDAAAGLKAAASVMERHFSGRNGLIAGRRLPIVLANAKVSRGESSFDRLIALLEWAEDDYSGWKQGRNLLWTTEQRRAFTVRTWEVQLFNMAHETAVSHGQAFFKQGLGYYTLAHVVARVLNQGAWGMVPPWLAQGLTDELDIQAHGKAWVGGDWWTSQTPGWFRPGWSGFLPTGHNPPPVVRGPPADLGTTVSRGGDSWQHRDHSAQRHWEHLANDLKSAAPASFRFMAEHESFLPRDRALARCLLHLLLELAPPEQAPGLFEFLDRVASVPPSGMPDTEPLTSIVSRVLGGVPAVDELSALPLGEKLDRIGQPEVKNRIQALGAGDLLMIADHREQALWLYQQTLDVLGWDARNELFNLILTAEFYEQLACWIPLGEALDRAMRKALEVGRKYPTRPQDRQKAAEAFWKGAAG